MHSCSHSVYELESCTSFLVVYKLCLRIRETAQDAIPHVLFNERQATKLHQSGECFHIHSTLLLTVNLL